MGTDTASQSSLGAWIDQAPIEFDRTPGWKYFLDRGDVFEADGLWFITNAEMIRAAERNTEVFSNQKAFEFQSGPAPLVPLVSDPPRHAFYRRAMDPSFAPRNINQLEGGMREHVGELIDRFIETGRCELMADLATPFPSHVFMSVFGLPMEDREYFLDLSHRIMHGLTLDGNAQDACNELQEYLKPIIDAKRADPGDDVLSKIVSIDGERAWTDDEILGMCQLMVNAGLDTVTGVIGFIFMHLAKDDELRRRIVADETLIPAAIEELLRLELPAPMTPRMTTREVEIGGRTIPAGAMVFMVFAAANRGPQWGDAANELDLDVAGTPHLTFGSGVHRCIGVHLARLELRVVVEEFVRRIPEFRIADGFTPKILWPSLVFLLPELELVWDESASA